MALSSVSTLNEELKMSIPSFATWIFKGGK